MKETITCRNIKFENIIHDPVMKTNKMWPLKYLTIITTWWILYHTMGFPYKVHCWAYWPLNFPSALKILTLKKDVKDLSSYMSFQILGDPQLVHQILCEVGTCVGCHVNEIIISLEIASLAHEMYRYLKPWKLQYQQ